VSSPHNPQEQGRSGRFLGHMGNEATPSMRHPPMAFEQFCRLLSSATVHTLLGNRTSVRCNIVPVSNS
jgi:hypothetical protein